MTNLVEVNVTAGRCIDIFGLIVDHDTEVFYHCSVFGVSTGYGRNYLHVRVLATEIRNLLFLSLLRQRVSFLTSLTNSLLRGIALENLVLPCQVKVLFIATFEDDICGQHSKVIDLID